MRLRIARMHGAVCACVLLAGCDAGQLVTPDASGALLAMGSTGAPNDLRSTAMSSTAIELVWSDNATNETGWDVHRSTTGPNGTFTSRATTGAGVTSHSDTQLTPLTEYCYKVRSFRTTGKKTTYAEFSSTSCSATPGPPPAPTNANATPTSSTTVRMIWSDNSGTEDGFRVERSVAAAGPWEFVAPTGPNATSYGDGGRPSEQQVCYRVIAFNAHGDSGPSNADCTVPPAGPTSLSAAPAGGATIDLAWADNSAVEDGYEVQRSADGVTFGTLATLPANSTSYRDAEAGGNATYWYRVQAKRNGGFSDPSNVASALATGCPQFETDCVNYVDDDCDGMNDDVDPDCNPSGCGEGCPPGYYCIDDECVSHCNDGVRNGDESDVDCGGSCGATCQTAQRCNGSHDCTSNSCVNNSCQAPKSQL